MCLVCVVSPAVKGWVLFTPKSAWEGSQLAGCGGSVGDTRGFVVGAVDDLDRKLRCMCTFNLGVFDDA